MNFSVDGGGGGGDGLRTTEDPPDLNSDLDSDLFWSLANWSATTDFSSQSYDSTIGFGDESRPTTTSSAVLLMTAAIATTTTRPSSTSNGTTTSAVVQLCNITDDPDCYYFPGDSRWLRHSTSVTVIYCVAYFTVFVLGVFGNSFVVAVVLRSPRMRTVTNYFIVNLAVADILVIILCLPATLLSNILNPWILGWFMCKTVVYVQGLSVAASIYSLVAVSFDRFLAICYPLRCQLTRARAKIVILVIWAVALVIPVPWAMYFELEVISPYHPDMFLCTELWPSREVDRLYFGVCNLLLCYIMPLLIITYCYVMIWVRVSTRSIIGETKDGQMESMMQRSKVKVVKMLVVVVIIFMVSWLPLYVIFARMKFGEPQTPGGLEEQSFAIIAPIAQWLGSANSSINFILYAFFNKKFRKGFVDIVKTRRCCSTVGRKYDDELCSTFRRAEYQKSRQWRHETQVEFVSTSVL